LANKASNYLAGFMALIGGVGVFSNVSLSPLALSSSSTYSSVYQQKRGITFRLLGRFTVLRSSVLVYFAML
jgi:hypothetical protein